MPCPQPPVGPTPCALLAPNALHNHELHVLRALLFVPRAPNLQSTPPLHAPRPQSAVDPTPARSLHRRFRGPPVFRLSPRPSSCASCARLSTRQGTKLLSYANKQHIRCEWAGNSAFDEDAYDSSWPDLSACPSTRRLSDRRLSGDPSSETCVRCTDKATDHMIDHGLTCATFSWGVDNKCEDSDREWITKGYCQQSCFDAGRGYADCCPSPPSPPAPPLPPPPAIPIMTAAESLGANKILSGATNGIPVNRTSPSSAHRRLSETSPPSPASPPPSLPTCKNTAPVSDRRSCSMKKDGITCANMRGIKSICNTTTTTGDKNKENGKYIGSSYCQLTCFYLDYDSSGTFRNGFSAGCSNEPPPPSSPPPSPCVMCGDNMPRGLKKNFGYTCGDSRDASSPNKAAVTLLLDKSCSKEIWIRKGYCQQSCFDADCGSADCCPVPSPPALPPAPPSPPATPPSSSPTPDYGKTILEVSPSPPTSPPPLTGRRALSESQHPPQWLITTARNGLSFTSSLGSTRRAAVSTLASCDAGSANDVTRCGLQVQNYVVLNPGDILDLSAIVEREPEVQEIRLIGGGEKPFETEGSWELPAGRTLVITAVNDTRVKIKVTGELAKVSGTLELRGLYIFREPFDDGCGGCEVGFPPLLDILEGGKVEIVESELRVVVGELAITVKGALVLREATIAGAPLDRLDAFASDTLLVTAMELLGSLGARFITGIERGMRHHHCSFPEVFFEDRCQ